MVSITFTQAQLAVSVASVFFAAVLTLVTYLYYRETKYQTKPVLKSTIDKVDGMLTRFAVVNTGRGAAHDVTVHFGFEHLDHQVDWTIPLIVPGEKRIFSLPFDSDTHLVHKKEEIKEEIGEEAGIIEFEAEYSDSFGRSDSVNEEINIMSILEQQAGTELVNKNEVREIRRELKKIRDILDE